MGEGPLAAVVFSDRPVSDYLGVAQGDRTRLAQVGVEMLRRRILVNLDVKFYLSLAHSEADVDAAVEAFEAGLSATAA
jgi:glutamate-1-semialdehyde aminotransferase